MSMEIEHNEVVDIDYKNGLRMESRRDSDNRQPGQ